MPDRSKKNGEAMCVGFVPDLQRIAGTKDDFKTKAYSHK